MSSPRYINVSLERSPVGMGIRKIAQWVTYDDFTDGGSTTGTLALTPTIPAGSFVLGSKVTVKTGFTGDTTCVMDIGDGSDADIFSQTTHNIFAIANNLMESADAAADGTMRGIVPISTETTVTLTATSGSDWGLVTAGKMLVEVFYFSTNVELDESYPMKFNNTI